MQHPSDAADQTGLFGVLTVPVRTPRRGPTLGCMDARAEASDFLKSRRARLTPDAVGLSPAATGRRVKGLRREEVATLAGVSAEYYNRMERGMLDGVSEPVLHAIARALRLDEAELTHLFDLARSVSATATPSAARRPSRPRTRQITQRLLDGMTEIPAYARNDRYDILAMNRLGAALLPGLKTDHPNLARYIFLDPHAQTFYAAWEQVARDTVAALRIEAGRNPFDRGLTDLLMAKSALIWGRSPTVTRPVVTVMNPTEASTSRRR